MRKRLVEQLREEIEVKTFVVGQIEKDLQKWKQKSGAQKRKQSKEKAKQSEVILPLGSDTE